MKILNILLLTALFITLHGYTRMGIYFSWELAFFIGLIWEYKLTGWNKE